jgi:PAS domain S-box-containing protein
MGHAAARSALLRVRSSGKAGAEAAVGAAPALADPLVIHLLDAMPTAVLVVEPDTGRVVSANRAFLELVGLEAEDVVNVLPPYGWWAGEEDDDSRRETATNAPAGVGALLRDKGGSLVPVEIERVTLSGSDGSTVLEATLVTDLRDRRRLEEQLVQSGKLAAIGELAAGVAHEINNPLFAILGFVEFLRNEIEPGTRAHERLLLIEQTGLEIKSVVRALLDFAREPSDVFMTLSLADVAAQTVELVRWTTSAKDVEIVERYPEEAPLVKGSPNQLKQIFLNLLTNAQQAMPSGGTVTVELACSEGWAEAVVADTGPGIAEDVLPQIFEPFFTRKQNRGGTGLGLSVSLGIAQMHGGHLTAESVPGKGAAFTLRLPLERNGDAP